MRKDELKKRSKGVAFVIALLVLTTSLSQCHKEPDEELLETINDSDNLDNEHHVIDDGSLDASKNNEHEHTHDFSVEESTEEASIKDVAPESSNEASTSNNVNSNKKKDKGKEDSSNSASTLASLIENIINPSKSEDSNDNQSDNSNAGGDNDNSDDNNDNNKDNNKGWHIHVWGPWKDNGANEIRTCLLNSSHTQTRNHSYGTYTYDPTTGKDSATCSQCGHVDQRDHLHHWGDWTDNGTNEIRRCNDDSSHTETRNHSYGAYVYDVTTGKDVATCSQCGHKISRDHEHHYGEWMDNGTNEKRVCSDDSTHVEYRDHTMGEYSYNNQTGKDEAHCSTCSHVDSIIHEHHLGNEQIEKVATADVCYKTYQVCSDCNEKKYNATVTTHTYTDWIYKNGHEERTCTICGFVDVRNHEHNWQYTTQNVDGNLDVCYQDIRYCDACGTTEVLDSHGHDYDYTNPVNAGDYEILYCNHNHSHTITQDHDWGNVYNVDSSTDRQQCNNCGATRDLAHTHSLSGTSDIVFKHTADVCYVDVQECETCHSLVEGEAHGHNYVEQWEIDEYVWKCSKCGDPKSKYEARIDMYKMFKDFLNDLKYREVFFDNSLLCDNKSKVLKKNKKGRL